MDDDLALARDLAEWQRAALLAAMTLLPDERALEALGRLVGGERCVAAAARVAALGAEERRRWAARMAEELSRPDPGEGVHPSWLERALARLDQRLELADIRARLDDPGADGARARWYARAAFAHIVHATPPRQPGAPRDPAPLARLLDIAPRALAAALAAHGIRQFAWALHPLSAREQASALLALPRPTRDAYARHARELASADPRLDMGPRRAAAHRCRGIDPYHDPYAFQRMGARALAPHLWHGDGRTGGDMARRLAQRLPIDLGTLVLDEFSSHFARNALDTVPRLRVFLTAVQEVERLLEPTNPEN